VLLIFTIRNINFENLGLQTCAQRPWRWSTLSALPSQHLGHRARAPALHHALHAGPSHQQDVLFFSSGCANFFPTFPPCNPLVALQSSACLSLLYFFGFAHPRGMQWSPSLWLTSCLMSEWAILVRTFSLAILLGLVCLPSMFAADRLGHNGIILLLFETPSGFAIFKYYGVQLFLPNAKEVLALFFLYFHVL